MNKKQSLVTFSFLLFSLAMMLPVTNLTAADKVYTLKLALHPPETSWQAGPFKRYIADIKNKTNGRVILHPYWAESLIPQKEAVNHLRGGLIDLAQSQIFNNPGEFPISSIVDLPFFASSTRGAIEGLRKLYAEGFLTEEYDGNGFKLLDFHAPGMQYLFFRDKKIDSLEQFKSLKIRSTSSVTVDMLKTFGATPVSMASSDLYMALDRGTIDGLLSSPGFMAPFKLYEVGKYFLDQPLFGSTMFVGMHQKTWDSLPADLQKIVMDCTRTLTDDWIDTSDKQENLESKEVLKEKGVTFYTLTPEELEKFKVATAPIAEKYIKKLNSMGLDGQKIVDTFKSVQGLQ